MAVLTQARVQHSTAFRLRKLRGQVLFWFVLSLFIIFACFPVYWMFLTTFKQVNDLYNLQNNPLLFQLAPTLDRCNTFSRERNSRPGASIPARSELEWWSTTWFSAFLPASWWGRHQLPCSGRCVR